MRSKKLFVGISLMLVLAIALSACGAATKAPEPTKEAPAAEKPGTGIKIVYIPKNTGNPYFDSIIRGFEQACLELGCEFTTTAPATAEATSQIPFVQEQIQRGVNVLPSRPTAPMRSTTSLTRRAPRASPS